MSEVFSYSFDWKMFFILGGFSIAGIVLGTAGFVRAYWHYFRVHFPRFKKVDLVGGYIAGLSLVSVVAIVAGIYLAPTVNTRYVFFMALMNQKNIAKALFFELLPALAVSVPLSLAYLYAYYFHIRSSMDEKSLTAYERARNHIGLGARIFFYGFFGEIVFRWGLQSALIWTLGEIAGYNDISVIVAIVLVALFQSYVHLLSYRLLKREMSRLVKLKTLAMNFIISIAYGILLWKFGIFSAMAAHAVLHIIWYPLDIFYYRKVPAEE